MKKERECLLCKYYISWYNKEFVGKPVINSLGQALGRCRIYKKNVHPYYQCARFKDV